MKKQKKVLKKERKPRKKIQTKKKIKTFDEYFEECIKNEEIPSDTPSFLREVLERAVREYLQGIENER